MFLTNAYYIPINTSGELANRNTVGIFITKKIDFDWANPFSKIYFYLVT